MQPKPKSKRNGKSSLSRRQPSRHGARARSCRFVQARERQLKAAQGSGGCVLPGGRNWRQSQGAQASVDPALETSREAGTHSSLLAAALRKGQQQCYLPFSIRNQGLDAFLVTLGQLHAWRAQATQSAAAQKAPAATIPATPPGIQARERATWSWCIEFWCSWLC